MSLIANLLGFEKRSDQAGNLPLNKWLAWLDGTSQGSSSAGIFIDRESMYTIAACYCAIRIIAETIGSMPLQLWRQVGKSRGLADDDPTFYALQAPNSEMHQMHFMMTAAGWGAARGNAFAQLLRDGKGRVKEMWPIDPDRVILHRKSGRLVYQVRDYEIGQNQDYLVQDTSKPDRWIFQNSGEMMHFRGFSSNGTTGMSPMQYGRNIFGLALAQEEYSSRLYSNGAMPRGVLKSKDEMGQEEFNEFQEQWKKLHQGIWNAHKTAVLPAGVEWQQISMTAEDAQYLLSRKFQLAEIARIFRVPLHLLQELDRSTFNNISQQTLEFLIFTMTSWLENWEQTINTQVLTETQREKGIHARFNRSALMVLDPEKLSQKHRTYVTIGVMNANECREELNLNPYEGGDEYMMQGAMASVENLQNPPEEEPEEEPADDEEDNQGDEKPAPKEGEKPKKTPSKQSKKVSKTRHEQFDTILKRTQNAFQSLIELEIREVQRKESATIAFKAKKLRGLEFTAWLDTFAAEVRQDFSRKMFPALDVASIGLLSEGDRSEHLRKRIERVADTYVAGLKTTVETLIERSGDSWPAFMLSLESVEFEQERGRLAQQIAENEIAAILALEDESHAA